jgi:hypothetical protein
MDAARDLALVSWGSIEASAGKGRERAHEAMFDHKRAE